MKFMANNFTLSLSLLSLVLLLLSFNLGTNMAQEVPLGMKSWCVAKASASDQELKDIIDYVCINQGFPCNIIQWKGPCYEPITLMNHASVVMNLYFQKYGHISSACFFKGSGLMVLTDPSYGSCLYSYNANY